MVSIVKQVGKLWDRIELAIGGLFLLLAVVLVVMEIIGRSFFSVSMIGADEIAAFAIIWSVFFTASIAVKRNLHVRIDVIFILIPSRFAKWLDLFGTTLSFVFACFLTYSGSYLVMESYEFGEMTMTMLRLPLWLPQLVMPIGGFLLAIRLLQRAIYLQQDKKPDMESNQASEMNIGV